MSDVALAIRLTADASDAAQAFDSVGDAAARMADQVETSTRDADRAADRLSGVADSADNLDSKAAQATGSLGALSSGFELVGADKYAGGLQAAALATDFLSGVGQGLNLILELQAVQTARARVAAAAAAVQQRVTAAATTVWTAAQAALNAVMAGNPIALVVLAVVALVAAIVVAYKRSETFRNIVQAVMHAAAAAIGQVWDIIKALGRFVGTVLLAYFRAYRAVVVAVFNAVRAIVSTVLAFIISRASAARDRLAAAFQAVSAVVSRVWAGIRDTVATVVGRLVDLAATVRARFADAWARIRDLALGAFNAVTAPVQHLIDLVQNLLDKIASIHLPSIHLPSIPGLGRAVSPGATSYGASSSGGAVYNITVNTGVGDPVAIGGAVAQVLQRRNTMLGYA